MNIVLSLGLIWLLGLLSARWINKIKFPAVTAYLLLGIIIGPSVFSLIPTEVVKISGLISNVVLGIIAFGIGQNFSKDKFREIGKAVLWISALEASGAWFLVTVAFSLILRQPFYVAILFGAIASATAPAATVMVIKEYQAKGNFTDTLLGVVAVDDAWCLIIFAISLTLSQAIFVQMVDTVSLLKVLLNSFIHIGGSFILGVVIAILLSYISRFIRTQAELLIFILGFIFLTIGIAQWLNLSLLLGNMFLGATLVNINKDSSKFFDKIEVINPPLFLLFFVLAGANLELGILTTLGKIGFTYLIVRVMGKVIGAYSGAHIAHTSKSIKKYLGLGLVPQAGVALGCALVVKSEFPEIGGMIFSTIVATTVIYELIGPICTKAALKKAGEITL
ncbi:MAG: cation:proton antiporter [bacterium]